MTETLGVSLLALSSRKAFLEPALCSVKRHIGEDDTKWVICNFILMQVSVFLEEWKLFAAHAKQDASVKATCQIADPALKRIRSWSGLKHFRNSVLAHTRAKPDNTLPTGDRRIEAFTPSNYAEQALLGECAVYAIATALIRHECVRSQALAAHGTGFNLSGGGIDTVGQYKQALLDIRQEICMGDPTLESGFGRFLPWPE